MPHRFNPARRHNLLAPERRKRLPAARIVRQLEIAPDHTVLDIGAGVGYFARALLRQLGSGGRLIAVDISPVMLEELEKNLPRSPAEVRTLIADAVQIPLPDRSADRILMALILHEIAEPKAALREARRLLKPDGRLLIVEWHKIKPPPGPPEKERLDPGELFKLARQTGFDIADHDDINRFHYLTLLQPVARKRRHDIIE
ncbi:MAG: class I SAM-dependent methyltransferase [candidate division WOR-3 bacterium]|uniref:Class I SAM-dependent methyltransferase n=1 Tax=candidate division WOR-3 bacterium TaxID=2052148 RepID=A0A7C3III6_UNCW3|nr:class I SAM-dependent methyltransferase [candidate division WOR-3 bacterium]